MKHKIRFLSLLLILSLLLSFLSSCNTLGEENSDTGTDDSGAAVKDSISIRGDEDILLEVGEQLHLIVDISSQKSVSWRADSSAVTVEGGLVVAQKEGVAIVVATLGTASDSVTVTVIDPDSSDKPSDLPEGDLPILPIDPDVDLGSGSGGTSGDDSGGTSGNGSGNSSGSGSGNTSEFDTDPYVNMTKSEFYANYEPAVCYMDAYYRSLHGFMSGSIAAQDQNPTVASYRPTQSGKFIRNSSMLYGEDGKAYYVTDGYGNVVNAVFKGGAYTALEDVAAYVFAFGDIPANHVSNKNADPKSSIWGEYLRLNHSSFSGDVSKYPYEPELPNISGCGGKLSYKEIDVGTTGTDCDPKYTAEVYNNGSRVVRGAARIVYAKRDLNGNGTYEAGEVYVFYTNNHYNDFREYLNYEGGWGEIFGNITGGGKISDKYNCSPSPYVTVIVAPIVKQEENAA